MCGIAGILGHGGPNRKNLVERMIRRIRHRGRDGIGMWSDENIVLGHTRLSIIDLSKTGHQPLSNENNSIWVVLNGEIYNYRELQHDLIARGHKFRGTSDTEVIPHLYEEYGVDFVNHLRGMFALALWDTNCHRLILARDRAGKKPLFYAPLPGGLAFASEMKALFVVEGVDNSIRNQGILDYLVFGVVPGPDTAYTGIKRVPPAHLMVWEDHRMLCQRYWNISFYPKLQINQQEAGEEVLRILREAIKLRLRSDVPVGCFLSGGIDSGLVTALASQELDHPLKTYSIYFQDEKFDERPLARKVVDRYRTEHNEFELKSQLGEDLERIISHYDEPYSAPSALPSFAVARLAAKEVKVVLNGDGGDEIFAGYRHFLAAKVLHSLRFLDDRSVYSLCRSLLKSLPVPKQGRTPYQFIYRFVRILGHHPAARYMVMTNDRLEQHEALALMGKAKSLKQPLRLLEKLSTETKDLGPLDSIMLKDFNFMLCDDHLVKMDTASMASTLEARSPFLDQELIGFVARLPENVKFPGWHTKPLLRALAVRLLPKEVAEAPKRGFEIPLLRWMKQDLNTLLHERVFDPSSYCMNHLDKVLLHSIIQGKRWDTKRWANVVWTLLCLEIWWSNYKDNISCVQRS